LWLIAVNWYLQKTSFTDVAKVWLAWIFLVDEIAAIWNEVLLSINRHVAVVIADRTLPHQLRQ
jgi:hypothetical protein